DMDMIEALSMGFFGVNHEAYNVLYIADDLFHSEMQFDTTEDITFGVEHTYTSITQDKSYGYRIYVTPNNPVHLAKMYKQHQVQQGKFKTLEEKADEQPNIRKLYGASHMYLWDKAVVAEENINWKALQQVDIKGMLKQLNDESITWLTKMLTTTEQGSTMQQVLKQIVEQDYIDHYQKNVICLFLSELLLRPDFYEPSLFIRQNERMEELIEKGVENLSETERIELNKHALQQSLPEVFAPVNEWTASRGIDLLEEMKAEGMDKLWIGLDHWVQGLSNPALVDYAVEAGYLIGPYDSYHSIHEPGKEAWHTATFEDTSLYEEATIINKEGAHEKGFQGVGRKLNPTASLDAVAQRVKNIMTNGVKFNTWFIDCDATGEIYDDYSSDRITTKEEDLQARLERMALVRDHYGMVIGSEGGNDFASTTLALAHGIELPSFSWMDADMKTNKESEYYLGRWYSPKGGVPEKFSKPVPVKEAYKKIFLDPVYSIPLFKLVYNDSVISSYHWDWSTFKIQDEVENRMLYEILYNVPPMYHLDKWEWDKYKTSLIKHSRFYEDFSEQAILLPMTSFEVLTEDRMVQTTTFGDTLQVVANFKDEPYVYEGDVIEAQSVLVYDGKEKHSYQP
ncbi:MAG: glycoside hydrolase, partial [Cellulosilyticaceae bacterium]